MNVVLFFMLLVGMSSSLVARPVVHVTLPDQEGVAAHFLSTGLYGVNAGDKGVRLVLGVPQCTHCHPEGFFSTIDLSTYIGSGPCWIGLHNLGGGFGVHRHRESRNNTVASSDPHSSLLHVEIVREKVVGMLSTPLWMVGVAFDGRAGGIDARVGCAPFTLLTNGGLVPTMHAKFLAETYCYTPTVSVGATHARLFAGGSGSALTAGESYEWGVTIAPGEAVEGLVGMQGGVALLKFGIAGGYRKRFESRTVMNADYVMRVSEYKMVEKTMADPLVVDAPASAYFVTSYIALAWDKVTLGVSGQTEWSLQKRKMSNLLSIALGCTL